LGEVQSQKRERKDALPQDTPPEKKLVAAKKPGRQEAFRIRGVVPPGFESGFLPFSLFKKLNLP
jgi:hypothetical protein